MIWAGLCVLACVHLFHIGKRAGKLRRGSFTVQSDLIPLYEYVRVAIVSLHYTGGGLLLLLGLVRGWGCVAFGGLLLPRALWWAQGRIL